MKCNMCGTIDFSVLLRKTITCKKCSKHMESLIYVLIEYTNILYSLFIKTEIVESNHILETCLSLCDNLSVYEKLGIRILDMGFWEHLDMKYHYTQLSDLRNTLIEVNDSIQERNVRISIYNNARDYEKDYKFEDAIIEYLILNKMYPFQIGPILSIADMYRKLNKLDNAIDFLLKAKETPYYKSIGNDHISYRHNLDKKLKDLGEKYSSGYVYRPRKKK